VNTLSNRFRASVIHDGIVFKFAEGADVVRGSFGDMLDVTFKSVEIWSGGLVSVVD
jgi:hypothetical protein